MPNKIKYTTNNTPNAIKVKNFVLGINNVAYGPTSITNFWNGITPPLGGYTVYINKAIQGPSIYVPTNDNELESIAKMLGATGNTLNWFSTQNNMICVNMDYPNIVTEGLITLYDVGFIPSYPKGQSNEIYDLSFYAAKGMLNGLIEYNPSHGGILTFESVGNSYITLDNRLYADFSRGLTICTYLNFGSADFNERIIEFYDSVTGNNIIFSRYETSNDLYFAIYSSGGLKGSVTFSNGIIDNQFAFYAVSLGTSQVNLYSNDNRLTSYLNLIPDNAGRDSCFIGKSSSNSDSYFGGDISTIMIYDRELSDEEINKNYIAYSIR